MITIFSIPERIVVEVALSPETLKLLNRILDEQSKLKEVQELMEKLSASTAQLEQTAKDNPDPNPHD